jgi:hypothetical protein
MGSSLSLSNDAGVVGCYLLAKHQRARLLHVATYIPLTVCLILHILIVDDRESLRLHKH